MLDINRKEEIDLKEIYGEKRYKKWINKKYPSLNNEDVQSWIRDMIFQYCEDGKNPKNFKIPTYMSPFQQFCNYNKVDNPSELLEEDIDQRNLRLRKYLTFLQNAPKKEIQERTEGFKRGRPARTTIRNMIQSRVKSFYSNRGRNISFGLKKAKSGKNKNEIHLTKSLVRKIQARIRVPNYKVISAFQSQLGLRIGDVLGTLIKKGYNIRKYKDHYYINSFKTQKNGITINFLFFTEDLTNTLLSVYGSKCNNDLTKLNLSSILRTREKNIIDRANYLNDLKRVIEELGIEENIKTHSFRKFFSSQVRKCKKVDDEFKEHLMGHSSYNLSQAYNNNLRDINWFYEEWLKIKKYLNINITDKTKDKIREHSKQIVELREKNQSLEDQIDLLVKEKRELSEVVTQIGNLLLSNNAILNERLPKLDLSQIDQSEKDNREAEKVKELEEKVQNLKESIQKLRRE